MNKELWLLVVKKLTDDEIVALVEALDEEMAARVDEPTQS